MTTQQKLMMLQGAKMPYNGEQYPRMNMPSPQGYDPNAMNVGSALPQWSPEQVGDFKEGGGFKPGG